MSPGQVEVDGTTISYVGPPRATAAGERVDLGNALLMPGLIDLDAVSDIDHALLDSWSSRTVEWSPEYAANGRRHTFDADQRRTVRRFAFAQLIAHGITSAMPIASEVHSEWAESYEDAVAMAEEAEALGLRYFGAREARRTRASAADPARHLPGRRPGDRRP
ncbi:hypothetical protein ACWGID_36590 [Kribbella sp. NPDC054772]